MSIIRNILKLFVCGSVLIGQDVFASLLHEPRLFSSWFGGSETSNKKLSDQYLPATLQVLEHTASQVNGTWGDESGQKRRQEVQPLPGLLRLTVLRNTLLSEAKAAQLDNYDGFTEEMTTQLQATSQLKLPEQLAIVIERTVEAGELKDVDRVRGKELSLLAYDVVNELRDRNSQLSSVLHQYESLKYVL